MSTSANHAPAHHARGVILMIVSAVSFSANVLLIRALGEIQTVNVWLVSNVRFVAGLGVLLLLYRRDLEFSHLFSRPKLALRGLIGSAGVYGFYLTVVHIGAGRATFINNTYVIFAALMAVWMLGERFRATLAAGSVAALAGLALLTNAFGRDAHANLYDMLAVLTAIGSAYVVVTIRQLHATEHSSTIFAAQCVYGLILCTVPAALHVEPILPWGWAVMLLSGVCAAAGQITMTYAFRDLPVAEGSLLQMLVPVGIAIGGVVFFKEHFPPRELGGAALILAGTALIAVRR